MMRQHFYNAVSISGHGVDGRGRSPLICTYIYIYIHIIHIYIYICIYIYTYLCVCDINLIEICTGLRRLFGVSSASVASRMVAAAASRASSLA